MPFIADAEQAGRFVPDGETRKPIPGSLNPNTGGPLYEGDQTPAPKTVQVAPGFWDFITGSARQGHTQSGLSRAAQDVVGKLEAGAAVATGATTGYFGGLAGAGNTVVKQLLSLAVGANPARHGTVEEGFNAGAAPFTYQPLTTAGQENAATASDIIARNAPALIAVAPQLSQASQALRGVQGVRGAGVANTIGMAGRATAEFPEQFFGETVGGAPLRAARGAGRALTPTLSPEMTALVKIATKHGIDVRPDQVSGSKLVKMAGEASTNVPLSGAKTGSNQAAFNSALLKQIDPTATATKLTPTEFAKAMTKAGNTIGEKAGSAAIPLDDTLVGGLKNHLSEVTTETPEVRAVNEAWVNKIIDAGKDGDIPGAALRKLDSQIGRQLKSTPDGDLRRTLIDVHEIMMDALERNLAPDDMAAFKDARRQYAIGKAIEPVVAKSIDGNFPAPQLMGRLTSNAAGKRFMAMDKGGEVGDLAKVGQLLKEPASSGTAERRFVYGALGSAASALTGGAAVGGSAGAMAVASTGAHVLAPVWLGANLYNRAGPALTRAMARGPEVPLPAPPTEPTLGLGFDVRPSAQPQVSPLGDLTPDWQTLLGAAPARQPGMPGEGLYRATGEQAPSTGTRATKSKPQQPVAPGRPDLPETMVSGAPAENAADTATGEAMQTPNAVLARKTQQAAQAIAETERLKESASPEVVNTLEAHAKHVAALLKAEQDASALEASAAQASDEGVKAALLKRAQEIRAAVTK